ncbi:MAG: sulfite exporter TauE/SafE family protein [Thermoplasmatales archaeon]|nr:sulfite exporter TauE/SafE family protein [Thermoplasmatales archaeon]
MEPILLLGLILVGLIAGVLGTLFGLGGGIIIIPCLTIIYGFGATEAAAVSLIGIIAISSGGTAFYLRNGIANVRLGLFLEVGTTIGAAAGALVAAYLDDWFLMLLFAAVMVFSALRMFSSAGGTDGRNPDGKHSYHDFKEGTDVRYDIEHPKGGFAACVAAGAVSSMTGVGGGVIKMPVMNLGMKVPIKAAAGTSSYMIGITAFAGSVVYFLAGAVPYVAAAFVVLGAVIGAFVGTRVSKLMDFASMKRYFSVLLLFVAASMVLKVVGVL